MEGRTAETAAAQKRNGPPPVLKLVGKRKGRYIASVALSVAGVACGVVPYYAVAQIVISLIGGVSSEGPYLAWCGVALAAYLAKALFQTLSTSISHAATFLVLRDLRNELVAKLTRMPMGNVLGVPSGTYKDVVVDRVEALETPLAHLLPEMVGNVLVPVTIIGYLFAIDWRMALASLVTLPVGMAFMLAILKSYPRMYEGSVLIGQRMSSAVVEYVKGIEVIKAFLLCFPMY